MAAGRITLADRAKMVGNDLAVGLIEANMNVTPEVDALFTRIINGSKYDTAVRIGLPSVGFRELNKGIAASKSEIDKRSVECAIFGGRVEVDKAAYAAGKIVGQTDLDIESVETTGVFRAAKIALGNQLIYGNPGLTDKGFPGLKSVLPLGGSLVVDAEGSTATTASSVYAIKTGMQDVSLVFGNGDVLNLGDFRDETIYDSDGNPIPGRVADLLGWVGLQIPHANCVGRIANLTAQTGKGVDDDILSELYAQFPIGYKPDFYLMSRRSARQLQKARGSKIVLNVGPNAANGTMAIGTPAPIYTADGVQIIVTDSILDVDAIETEAPAGP